MSSFKDVVGHKNIIKYIESAVQADAVSHAYILNGERGSGKKLLANLFAMSLQCQDRDENGEACGKCQSCKQALHGNQPDIVRVSHEKPTTISVDDIRQQVNNDIVIKPYSSKYKIYIIPEADLMSVQTPRTPWPSSRRHPEASCLPPAPPGRVLTFPETVSLCWSSPDYRSNIRTPCKKKRERHILISARSSGPWLCRRCRSDSSKGLDEPSAWRLTPVPSPFWMNEPPRAAVTSGMFNPRCRKCLSQAASMR